MQNFSIKWSKYRNCETWERSIEKTLSTHAATKTKYPSKRRLHLEVFRYIIINQWTSHGMYASFLRLQRVCILRRIERLYFKYFVNVGTDDTLVSLAHPNFQCSMLCTLLCVVYLCTMRILSVK